MKKFILFITLGAIVLISLLHKYTICRQAGMKIKDNVYTKEQKT
jgi:hypothetical protein